MDNRLLEDKNELPAKSQPECLPCGVGRTSLATSGHHLHLSRCLVGPDVRLVGAGTGLVGLVWFVGLFFGMMQCRMFCAFVLRLSSIFALF